MLEFFYDMCYVAYIFLHFNHKVSKVWRKCRQNNTYLIKNNTYHIL